MKVIYIADDGIQFNDRWDCEEYEWVMSHPNLKDVHIFDANGNEFEDIFDDEAYDRGDTVIIFTEAAVEDFILFARRAGFCNFENINEVGVWKFDENNERYRKVE